MQIELHRNNVYQGVELLLLVPILFQLAIPKCLLIFKENFYYTSLYTFSIIIYYPKDHSYTRLIIGLTDSPFSTYQEDGAEYRAQCATLDKLPRYLKLRTPNRNELILGCTVGMCCLQSLLCVADCVLLILCGG